MTPSMTILNSVEAAVNLPKTNSIANASGIAYIIEYSRPSSIEMRAISTAANTNRAKMYSMRP